MKSKKGFTLIELLAVIVILGILMVIAIPSVTEYIINSRKSAVISSAKVYINTVTNDVNDLKYSFFEEDIIYAIPIECVALETGGTTPFGEWHQAGTEYWAYVLVQYNPEDVSYTYGFTFKDSSGHGIYPTSTDELDSNGNQILSNIDLTRPISGKILNIAAADSWNGFSVTEDTSLIVLEAESENTPGNNISTCTLAQKGTNYDEIDKQSRQPIKLINGKASLSRDISLIDKAIYNHPENTEEVTINGNGHTVNQSITSADVIGWNENGTIPNLAYIFSSTNGSKVTVNDLNFTGVAQTIMLGHYIGSTYTNFNTEFNNVTVKDLEIFSFSQGIAPAVIVYGNATLNNCNIYGTKLSELDTGGDTVYDLAIVNYTKTYVNDSKIGTVYTWTHAYLELNNSTVDTIVSSSITSRNARVVVANGSTVGTIKANYPRKIAITVEAGSTVDTIDLTSVTDLESCSIVIEDGATVNNIIYP